MSACPILCLVTIVGLLNFAASVRLQTNSKYSKTPKGENAPCGQIRCFELGKYSNITVFKHTDTSSGTKLTPLGSVGPQNANLNTKSQGIRVTGRWTSNKAEIAMYPLDAADCKRVTLSCLMEYTNKDGSTHESFATLGKRDESLLGVLFPPPPPPPRQDVQADSTGGAAEHTSSAGEVSLAGLAVHLSSMMSSFGNEVRRQQERLEDKICNITETLVKVEGKMGAKSSGYYMADDGSFGNIAESLEGAYAQMEMMKAEMRILEQTLEVSSRYENASTEPDTESELNVTLIDVKTLSKDDIQGIARQSFCQRGSYSGGRYSLNDFYVVYSPNNVPLFLCDAHTDGGGWIVIQRRVSGDYNFYQDWESYKNGFGSLASDFWLGNKKIHLLTYFNLCELNITMTYKSGKSHWAYYDSFSVAGEEDNYRLKIGNYKGTVGNYLKYHNGMQFSTFDKDNDNYKDGRSCAKIQSSAWWYNRCSYSDLNAPYGNSYLRWNYGPLTYTEMKIRYVHKGL